MLTGLIVGLVVTRLASGVMTGLLYGVVPSDAVTAFTVAIAPLLVGGIATLLPWYRATRIAPIEGLRRG